MGFAVHSISPAMKSFFLLCTNVIKSHVKNILCTKVEGNISTLKNIWWAGGGGECFQNMVFTTKR